MKDRGEIPLMEIVRIRHVIIGILQYVKIYKTQSGCKFVEKLVFMHKEIDSQPYKRPKKNGGKGSVS